MERPRNVGGVDRAVRGVLAVVFLFVALVAVRRGSRGVAVISAVMSLGLGANAILCFCTLNRLLGIDTTTE